MGAYSLPGSKRTGALTDRPTDPQISRFLADHPEEDVSLAQFNFSRPNAMDAKVQKRRRLELLGAVAGSSGDSPPHKLLRTS